MKEIRFQIENAEKFLVESGYIKRDTYEHTDYVFDTKDGRFHSVVKGKMISLHFDKLVNGFHQVFPSIKRLKEEKKRIVTKIHKVIKNEFCYYCLNCGKASGDGDGLVGKKCLLVSNPTPND